VSYGVHPHGGPAEALTSAPRGKKAARGWMFVNPEFLNEPWSKLTSGERRRLINSSASRSPRGWQQARIANLGGLRGCSLLSTSRTPQPPHDNSSDRHGACAGKSPSGQARRSRQHRRRGGEIRRKGAGLCGCQAAVPARFRIPPPDSGVVPFSEEPLSPIKSDANSSGRVGSSFGGVVHASIVPGTAWGENRDPSDRACGIS